MTTELLLAFIAFAFVTSVTPGPNNMMLLASGINFGLRRSLPHLLGISLGMLLMVSAIGFGLGELLKLFPPLYNLLRYGGAAYLLYLSWKIATSAAPQANGESAGSPMSFFQAAAFQWVNPKAWIMSIAAISTYAPAQPIATQILLIAGLFALINYPTCSLWILAGSLLRRALQNPLWLRRFNYLMALMLVLSLYPILLPPPGVV
ncbi:MAG: LysE family translocator [Pseudomonas sp.]|uniref:LysE family translocator n=1 Tax=Pseudomonas sp. TaxID=306 RepID=UPI003BB489ED